MVDKTYCDSMEISRRMGVFGGMKGREVLRSSQKHLESNEVESQPVEGEAITSQLRCKMSSIQVEE